MKDCMRTLLHRLREGSHDPILDEDSSTKTPRPVPPGEEDLGQEADHEMTYLDPRTPPGLPRVVSMNIAREDRERQQWSSPLEFLLSCIAMSVGLGNVWRFPFTAYENGGGAFLLPYFTVLLLVGRPLYFLEVTLGQFSSRGSIRVWDMVPPLQGVGYAQLLVTCCIGSYYCALIALCLYYLAASCTQSDLPWVHCWPQLDDNRTVCVDSNTNGEVVIQLWPAVDPGQV